MKTFFWALLLLPVLALAQPNRQPDAASIKLRLKKLNVLGSVLYVAAHPDDENTKVISYLSNGRLVTTGYLAMTRGDGGQNLIGPEIRDLLGLIRTQELLAARRIDGGQQFFTRANDFGFSKSADEAFRIWGKDEILSDVVKTFRQFQPDVIITRFPPDARAGHGHHTASAILAGEAFDAAAKADQYPDQVKQFGTWQVKRYFTNTGRWWNKEINENTPGIITLDVGGFNPLLGKSYSEISALSSSQHKSQGWGRAGERGYQPEFLEPMKGEPAQKDIFEGIETTWLRVKGGDKIRPLVEKAIAEFKDDDPSASVPLLFQIRNDIARLGDDVWKKRKLAETEQLIQDCLGLFIEARSSWYQGSPGKNVKTSIELVSRSSRVVNLETIQSPALAWDTTFSAALVSNQVVNVRSNVTAIVPDAQYSSPYWLKEEHTQGRFSVTDKNLIGLPENPPAITFTFVISTGGETLRITKPLIYKWVDPVKGELWRPFEIVPEIFVRPSEKVMVFNSQNPKEIVVTLSGAQEQAVAGTLSLRLPAGWRSEPSSIPFEVAKRMDIRKTFLVYPPATESNGTIEVIAEAGGKKFDQSLQLVSYDHFPIQTILPKAQIRAIRLDLQKEGSVVGYINGAGDEIPNALRNMGYQVWEMKDEEVTPANLKRVDAVVLGVRALNTNNRIGTFMPELLDYVKNGGTMVVQYNTNFDMETDQFSPYPLKLSRDRVTEEDAEVRFLKPDHELLNTPNKITAADFSGWVQERGLYFPAQWDDKFEALLSMNDTGETPKNGSLLVAQYGQGHYVYTGLSFFRELPEGVTGAYKLFANMVSLGKSGKLTQTKMRNKSK